MMEYKVSMLGDTSVGKTSLLKKITKNDFNNKQNRTLTPEQYVLKLDKYTINFWDTIGQNEYNVLGSIYYKNCDLIILVYDITNENSQERVLFWIKEIRKMALIKVPILIIANKIDIENKNKLIKVEENDDDIKYLEMSAKTGKNIDKLKKTIINYFNKNTCLSLDSLKLQPQRIKKINKCC